MTPSRLLPTALGALLLCGSFAAHAESKEVVACYGVCNRTVASGARNGCFKDCRSQGASAAPAGKPAAKDPEQEELKWNRSKERSCSVRCSLNNPQGTEGRRICEESCQAIHQGKASGIKDRWSAEKSVGAEEKKLKGAGNVRGKPGPVAERTKALAAYNRALAILKAANKIQAGHAGFIGETQFRGQRLRDLQQSAESQFQRGNGELYVYETVGTYANQIIREYNESLKAPRYGGETY